MSGENESEDQEDTESSGRTFVLYLFGEVMLRFQLLELNYWQILAMRMKSGITEDQGMRKVEGWDSQTTGRLVAVLGLPQELRAEADEAVKARNYFAHRFMRDRAIYLHDEEFCEFVVRELEQVMHHIDGFEERLTTYIEEVLGFVDLDEEQWRELGFDQPPDPSTWLDDEPNT